MTSLQRQLALWLAGTLVVMLGLHLWLVRTFPRYLTEEYVVTRLQHDGDGLLSRLRISPEGHLVIARGPMAPIYETPYSGHYFVILRDDTTLKSRSLWDQTIEVRPAAAGETRVERLAGPQQEPLLVWIAGVQVRGQLVTLAVAEEISHLEDDIAEMQQRYLLAIALAAIVLIAVQAVILRRILRPIAAAHLELQAIAHGQRTRVDARVPDEFQPFIDELNRLLALMQQRLERYRKATGNLAHALKTPLTLLAQLRESETVRAVPGVHCDLGAIQSRLHKLVDSELRRARLAGGATPGRLFAVDAELRGLAQVMERLYQDRGISCEIRAPKDFRFAADREDVLELFGNLLDNACKWAKARVLVTVDSGPGLRARVEDDGPGIAPDNMAELTTRGLRIDETTPGHGLGLSIVDDIVAQYGGSLEFSRSSALGGLACTLRLPAPRSA